ncbi:MAG: DNA polymerase III subunit delta [Candidatus Rokubacteria bacterium]|nr:DNA polymerase III subunit delta [Candidatus Rokubacteria bacterium]
MDYAGFLREVEEGRVPPVALLHGDEPRLLDDALTAVSRALFSDPSLLALNREVFDAGGAPVEEIIRAALTLPSLAPARLVVVKSAQALPAKSAGALSDYTRDPNPTTRLVLLAGESLDAGHWLPKALPPASVIGVPRLTGRGLLAWLQARARAEGYELAEGAAQLLIRWVGEDLSALSGELEKALLFAGSRSITEEHIQGVVGEHRVLRTFELTDAVERGETGRALTLLESLLASGEEPLAILGTLARQARTTWQVGEWRRQGKPVEAIAALLRRPSFAVQALSARAGALPAAHLSRALRRCWEVEGKLKSGGRPRAELTLLIADLCRTG